MNKLLGFFAAAWQRFKHREQRAWAERPVVVEVYAEGRVDTYSPTWQRVAGWATDELAKARESNDSLSKDSLATAALRGRIKLLKELLALPDPPKERIRTPAALDDSGY